MSLILLLILSATADRPVVQIPSAGQAVSIPVAFEPADRDEYVLGPGDVLEVTVEGGATPAALASGLFPQTICTVSSDGMLSVSGIGRIEVLGLTIGQAELELARLTRSYYPGIRVGMALSIPRIVRVRASGAVSSPGIYPMYALQSVSDLLLAAGAATACSRTGWMYTDSDSLRFDLRLDPWTHEPASDPLLTGGSTVVFETCRNPVFIVGTAVDSSSITPLSSSVTAWEVDGPMSLPDFLAMTGGVGADFDPGRSGLMDEGVLLPIWSDGGLVSMTVSPGDTLFLAQARASVTVAGAVAVPSAVRWTAGLRTVDYVNLAGGLVENSSTGGISLIRNGETVARGSEASAAVPAPGDIIQVPYSWASRHTSMFTILGALVSAGAILYNLNN
ncbi:MAG TPA: polysaccharide biosynthesis/export family protein [Candidatus Fermentibacter daniensis]|nr:polysaccharide biosynthesis/export family protein [Candidatus Fermentibacter daniensis]HQH92399.1 polysaccharide biosynthesis/export family protein [Candidatus Fermentibacter daniensis]